MRTPKLPKLRTKAQLLEFLQKKNDRNISRQEAVAAVRTTEPIHTDKDSDMPHSIKNHVPETWIQCPNDYEIIWDIDGTPFYYLRDKLDADSLEAFASMDPHPNEDHNDVYNVEMNVLEGSFEETETAIRNLNIWWELQKSRKQQQEPA